jgi:transglutaminase-like putative cysteine protease
MLLRVRHRTEFEYRSAANLLAQLLRMTPSAHAGLRVASWSVRDARGRALPSFRDGFGNLTHLQTLHRAHRDVGARVEGVVETRDTAGVISGAPEPLPPAFYLRATPLTAPDPALEALAEDARRAPDPLARLHRLLGLVHAGLAYRAGTTGVATTAREAWAGGAGVCQDFAHVFVCAARALGQPARYVGGYLHAARDPEAKLASHAWAEAFVPELGWVGFDASAGICPDARYVRTGIGLDYSYASPVRGVRRGEGGQTMRIQVQVAEVSAQ